jgi:NTP pyrophosphatase (non-canonical NTP hydrolase)
MNIHKKMIRKYSGFVQTLKPVEECAEFIQAVIKHRNFNGSSQNVIEEFYDVLFTMNYTKEHFGITDVMITEAMKIREAHCEELLK